MPTSAEVGMPVTYVPGRGRTPTPPTTPPPPTIVAIKGIGIVPVVSTVSANVYIQLSSEGSSGVTATATASETFTAAPVVSIADGSIVGGSSYQASAHAQLVLAGSIAATTTATDQATINLILIDVNLTVQSQIVYTQ